MCNQEASRNSEPSHLELPNIKSSLKGHRMTLRLLRVLYQLISHISPLHREQRPENRDKSYEQGIEDIQIQGLALCVFLHVHE